MFQRLPPAQPEVTAVSRVHADPAKDAERQFCDSTAQVAGTFSGLDLSRGVHAACCLRAQRSSLPYRALTRSWLLLLTCEGCPNSLDLCVCALQGLNCTSPPQSPGLQISRRPLGLQDASKCNVNLFSPAVGGKVRTLPRVKLSPSTLHRHAHHALLGLYPAHTARRPRRLMVHSLLARSRSRPSRSARAARATLTTLSSLRRLARAHLAPYSSAGSESTAASTPSR